VREKISKLKLKPLRSQRKCQERKGSPSSLQEELRC